jgi:hypothetical protein
MNKHDELKKNFKRLYEYTSYIVDDVEEPTFETMTEDESDLISKEPVPQPTPAPVEPKPQAPVAQPEPTPEPSTNPPVSPVQQNIPPAPQQSNDDFRYTKIIGDLNNLNISVHSINTKFEQLMSSIDYLNKTVEEVREPSNEEKLLAMTKQSYPFNQSMLDVWGTTLNTNNDSNIITTPDGTINKVGDTYEMDVDLSDLPKQINNINHIGSFN